jgi:hypothetical protein
VRPAALHFAVRYDPLPLPLRAKWKDMSELGKLKARIEPVRVRLTNHPLYQSVQTPAQFRKFMEYHVYAVWDFMSLLKALQRKLTCVEVPWVPVGNPDTRFFINEIVVGEENDVDPEGHRLSHYELYMQAMTQAGANTRPIHALIQSLSGGAQGLASGLSIDQALDAHSPNAAVKNFLRFTFDTIASGKVHAIASVFAFGREDLIPDLFLPILNNLSGESGSSLSLFKYYLERHIEVDGDHHGHLAMSMVSELCGTDPQKWEEAGAYAQAALEARIQLWDAVVVALQP